jgi:ATP-independent RNA helicase DbpA
VTTDLASRGLDISGVKNIIHYQGAQNESVFIHRNGRTARMDKEGTIWIVLSSTETIPDFVPKDIFEVTLSEASSPQHIPYFSTLYFGAGKKDKIRKTDIVGLLIQKGGLKKEEVGLVDISDFESFAAVPTEKISILVKTLSTEKIKNRRIKIACSE